jgi:hypothetical protein
VVIEPGFGGDLYVMAYWTPPYRNVERSLIISSSRRNGSPDLIAAKSSLENLLLHVYEQGRVDCALGF